MTPNAFSGYHGPSMRASKGFWEPLAGTQTEMQKGVNLVNQFLRVAWSSQAQFLGGLCYRTRVRSLGMLVTNWLTNWLTDSCLVNLIDVTLVCEDAYSKLVEIVTVAGVKDRVGNSLLQIWKLMRFGQKAKLLFQLWAQGLVKILKLKLRQELKQEFGHFFFSADVL